MSGQGEAPQPPEAPRPRTGTVPVVSLAARHAPAIWAVVAGVVASTAIAVTTTARAGVWALAALLYIAGAVRLVRPSKPGPVGLAVRSRPVDVTLYWLLAAAITAVIVTKPI